MIYDTNYLIGILKRISTESSFICGHPPDGLTFTSSHATGSTEGADSLVLTLAQVETAELDGLELLWLPVEVELPVFAAYSRRSGSQ